MDSVLLSRFQNCPEDWSWISALEMGNVRTTQEYPNRSSDHWRRNSGTFSRYGYPLGTQWLEPANVHDRRWPQAFASTYQKGVRWILSSCNPPYFKVMSIPISMSEHYQPGMKLPEFSEICHVCLRVLKSIWIKQRWSSFWAYVGTWTLQSYPKRISFVYQKWPKRRICYWLRRSRMAHWMV